ncbi:YitT family protein [Nocardioides sp. Kera G14]|uniref:YitT family protein n=1 Tax=Nocardioides sp. Kera G14 TaxID=2884264 RepID=UPI001D0FEC53|nr:YitT family protein [Nocardioides sp. Kera G14]UDY24990.1 YitT family protein [Nocardioides sp. Kera G14]
MTTVVTPLRPVTPAPLRHTPAEDALGLLTGPFVSALGLALLHGSGIVTGGTAGLSLLLSYLLPVPFAVIFSAVNLPFIALAIHTLGWNFALRTVGCVALVSVFSLVHTALLPDMHLATWYSALVGNLLCGIAILILFRHRSSLGGFNIVCLLLQERLGLRAGYVQMGLDVAVVLCSLATASPVDVLISAGGAVVLNLVLAFNHRPGRYTAA